MSFGNYKRVIYLAQTDDPELSKLATRIADYLGLEFEERFSGYGDLERDFRQKVLLVS